MCLPNRAQKIEEDDCNRKIALYGCAILGLFGVVFGHYQRLSQDTDHRIEMGNILYLAGNQATSSQVSSLTKKVNEITKIIPRTKGPVNANDLPFYINDKRCDPRDVMMPFKSPDGKNTINIRLNNKSEHTLNHLRFWLQLPKCKTTSPSPEWMNTTDPYGNIQADGMDFPRNLDISIDPGMFYPFPSIQFSCLNTNTIDGEFIVSGKDIDPVHIKFKLQNTP